MNYENIEWKDKTEPKPTEEELNIKGKELKKDNMRQERNQLFKVVILSFIGLSKYK